MLVNPFQCKCIKCDSLRKNSRWASGVDMLHGLEVSFIGLWKWQRKVKVTVDPSYTTHFQSYCTLPSTVLYSASSSLLHFCDHMKNVMFCETFAVYFGLIQMCFTDWTLSPISWLPVRYRIPFYISIPAPKDSRNSKYQNTDF